MLSKVQISIGIDATLISSCRRYSHNQSPLDPKLCDELLELAVLLVLSDLLDDPLPEALLLVEEPDARVLPPADSLPFILFDAAHAAPKIMI